MKRNKILSAILAISMILPSLAACTADIPDEEINNDSPVIEDPITEEPVSDAPVIEEPVTEEPVIEEPVTEEPVSDEPEKVETAETDLTLFTVTKPEDYVYPSEEILYLRENLPRMDGSTSLILLEMGLKAKIFDISFTEALAQVEHTTTYGSFERLLNKEVDMIFSTPLSDEQYKQAAQQGMDLELVPIAAEAFVFIVNADNPVDSLTQQQIKDIYSGKITNWKELGGDDIEIVAFQRNRNSGSQNYMKEFMGDTELTQAPTEKVPDAMNSLIDAIKSYDNSQNAIGYSVYAYAADMYGLGDTLKFIKVDGIEPSKENMATKEYPLVNYNYAIYDKNTATEATVRTAAWLQTYDGQIAVAEAGYVPYGNVQREYLELTGTGHSKPEDYKAPSFDFTAYTAKLTDEGYNYTYQNFEAYERTWVPETLDYIKTPWQISCLANKELEAEINRRLSELEAKMNEKLAEVPEYLELLKTLSSHTFNKTSHIYRDYFYTSYTDVEITVKNGYMCILAGVYYTDGADRMYCYHAEAAYYDLIDGKEVSFTDLFYEGTDVDKAIYDLLTGRPLGSYNQGFFLSAVPFSEITRLSSEDHFAMSFDKIYFTHDNPIFCVGEMFNISLDSGYLCVEEARNMDGIFTENITVRQSFIGKTYGNVEYVNVGKSDKFSFEFSMRVNMLPETGENAERNKKINAYVRDYIKTEFDYEKKKAAYLDSGRDNDSVEYDLEYFYADTTFELTEYEAGFITLNGNAYWYNVYLFFDGASGEVTDYTVFLKDGWREHSTVVNSAELYSSKYNKFTDEEKAYIEKNEIPPKAEFYAFEHHYVRYGVPSNGDASLPLIFGCPDSGQLITVHVDHAYVQDFTN